MLARRLHRFFLALVFTPIVASGAAAQQDSRAAERQQAVYTISSAGSGQMSVGTLDLDRYGPGATPLFAGQKTRLEAFALRQRKAVLAIQEVFASPAILAVQEVEDLAILSDLAQAASTPSIHYRAYMEPGTDATRLHLGFLVNTSAVEVHRVGAALTSDAFAPADGSASRLLWQHPPLILQVSSRMPGASAVNLTLINVHFAALLQPEPTATLEQLDEQRTKQGASLAALVNSYRYAGESTVVLGNFEDTVSTGDLNVLTPVQPDEGPAFARTAQLALDDLILTLPVSERYNTVSNGVLVAPERILASPDLHAKVQQVHFTSTSSASDNEKEMTPAGLGRHDGQLATLTLAARRFAAQPGVFSGNFGSEVVASVSAPRTIRIIADPTNLQPVTFQPPVITGPSATDFAITGSTCGTLAPGEECAFTLTFTPAAMGARSGTFTARNDSVNAPDFMLQLSGIGTSPLIATENSLNFGNREITSRSGAQTILLTNQSAKAVVLGSPAITGDFEAISTCPAALSAHASCSISIVFTPSATGIRSGELTFGNTSLLMPIPLTGNGTGFTLGLAPLTGSTIAGKPVASTVALTPSPGYTGTITLTCSTEAPASLCQLARTDLSLTAETTDALGISTTSKYLVVGFGGLAQSPLAAALAMLSTLPFYLLRRRTPRARLRVCGLFSFAGLFACSVLSGCGGQQPPQNATYTAPGTYTYTVVATDGILTHSTKYSLTVRAY